MKKAEKNYSKCKITEIKIDLSKKMLYDLLLANN